MTPINEHCKELLERLAISVADAQRSFHTHEPQNAGHDPSDEDPNAWSNE